MAFTRPRRRFRGSARSARRSGRRSRWIAVAGTGISIPPGTFQVLDLLTPLQPPATIADTIYQQMTKPTLIAVMGHLTLSVSDPIAVPGFTQSKNVDYAWGIYRDVDFASLATALPAYSDAYSNSWMVHKTGSLGSSAIYSQSTAGAAFSATKGDTDFSYRRYELNLRKYKRTLDSFNDTLVLSVENATPASAFAGTMSMSFFFRMLLLE